MTPEVAAAVVETYRSKFQERGSSGYVYVRGLEGAEERERARLSGPEVNAHPTEGGWIASASFDVGRHR